jgi:hypothetical protein
LASSHPATSANVVVTSSLLIFFAGDRPILKMSPGPPRAPPALPPPIAPRMKKT